MIHLRYFGFLIILWTNIIACSRKHDTALITSDADTLASSVVAKKHDSTAINNNLTNQNQWSSEDAALYARYDSLYEHNPTSGLLTKETETDSTLKFMIYGFDYYDAPIFKADEQVTGIYLKSQNRKMTTFGVEIYRMEYDTTWKRAQILITENESKRPLFVLKGITAGKDVFGVSPEFDFAKPGDSIHFALGERNYTFSISGKLKGNIIYNYALVLRTHTRDGVGKDDTLISRMMMPLPNTSDIIPDFIYWAGDLNHDGLLDLISGDGMKSCATYVLWFGDTQKRFIRKARFDGCGC